jgi:hypothetical protein
LNRIKPSKEKSLESGSTSLHRQQEVSSTKMNFSTVVINSFASFLTLNFDLSQFVKCFGDSDIFPILTFLLLIVFPSLFLLPSPDSENRPRRNLLAETSQTNNLLEMGAVFGQTFEPSKNRSTPEKQKRTSVFERPVTESNEFQKLLERKRNSLPVSGTTPVRLQSSNHVYSLLHSDLKHF